MSPEMLTAHMAIGRSKGVPCIVRCSGPDHYFIKWVLDAGADGIIVPQVPPPSPPVSSRPCVRPSDPTPHGHPPAATGSCTLFHPVPQLSRLKRP